MAKINLTVAAAKSVHSAIAYSVSEYEVPEYGFFDGHKSESQMMADFQRRSEDLRKLLVEYKKVIDRDVKALDDACNSIIRADKKAAAQYRGSARRGGGSR